MFISKSSGGYSMLSFITLAFYFLLLLIFSNFSFFKNGFSSIKIDSLFVSFKTWSFCLRFFKFWYEYLNLSETWSSSSLKGFWFGNRDLSVVSISNCLLKFFKIANSLSMSYVIFARFSFLFFSKISIFCLFCSL